MKDVRKLQIDRHVNLSDAKLFNPNPIIRKPFLIQFVVITIDHQIQQSTSKPFQL